MATRIELKRGPLGDVFLETSGNSARTVRDLSRSRWLWLARRLASREARALCCLGGLNGVPQLIALEHERLIRSFVPGKPMHHAAPRSRRYFRDALRLVRRMHRLGVVHNDLAKEANWLCTADGSAGIVDFQLSICFRRRGRWFRLLAREDLRHLLKHKRHYLPDALTARERRILATPLWPARWWRRSVKPVYLFVTRRLMGWQDRVDASERQRPES